MYKTIEVSYGTSEIRKAKRLLKDDGYISSAAISKMIANGEINIPFTRDTFFTKAKKLVQKSNDFTGVKFIISGIARWYYPRKDIQRIVDAVTS